MLLFERSGTWEHTWPEERNATCPGVASQPQPIVSGYWGKESMLGLFDLGKGDLK